MKRHIVVLMMLLIATLYAAPVSLQYVASPAFATTDSRLNKTNEQHNYSGGDGAPEVECTNPCDNSGNSIFWANGTAYDNETAEGDGAYGFPPDHCNWIRIRDTGDTEWIRNFTGEAGHGENAVYAYITYSGDKVNWTMKWTIPLGFETGSHDVSFNMTDNYVPDLRTEQFRTASLSFTVASAAPSIAIELRKHSGLLERIDVGYWGNISFDAADTNVILDTNYLRAENDGDFDDQQWTVDFSGVTWLSAVHAETIPIDTNVEWSRAFSNNSADAPGNIVGDWSGWNAWMSDTTGSHEFTFHVKGEYCWVRIRILDVAADDTLNAGTDYEATYTATTS